MKNLLLFTDGSVNTKTKVGFGAYLVVTEENIAKSSTNVNVKRFENSSSTKLELQTLLWALNKIKDLKVKIIIYTDSQNIIGLNSRREKLEQNNFYSAKGRLFNNSELYKEFYKLTDILDLEFVKVKGHLKSSDKNNIDKLFTLVDRASRNALRNSNL